ncbi:MAG: class I SAM-dependent methyltransferase [Gammaproteobacteria bacterium]|nr:class I SAM-dependent methyltransferase [Gammaproteobacteria bacterium]
MQRVPEPELMDQPEQAHAYATADFETAHQGFIDHFKQAFPEAYISGEVLDLGCGPCDISRRFALAFPDTILHAVDGAPAMLAEASRLNSKHGLAERIVLIESLLSDLQLPQAHYHTLISNSLLHHLHKPHQLWQNLRQHAQPEAKVFIVDLMRPADTNQAHALVEQYAVNEPEVLREDFYHSLCAAFTPDEVQQQLDEQGLSKLHVQVISDRHMIIFGSL